MNQKRFKTIQVLPPDNEDSDWEVRISYCQKKSDLAGKENQECVQAPQTETNIWTLRSQRTNQESTLTQANVQLSPATQGMPSNPDRMEINGPSTGPIMTEQGLGDRPGEDNSSNVSAETSCSESETGNDGDRQAPEEKRERNKKRSEKPHLARLEGTHDRPDVDNSSQVDDKEPPASASTSNPKTTQAGHARWFRSPDDPKPQRENRRNFSPLSKQKETVNSRLNLDKPSMVRSRSQEQGKTKTEVSKPPQRTRKRTTPQNPQGRESNNVPQPSVRLISTYNTKPREVSGPSTTQQVKPKPKPEYKDHNQNRCENGGFLSRPNRKEETVGNKSNMNRTPKENAIRSSHQVGNKPSVVETKANAERSSSQGSTETQATPAPKEEEVKTEFVPAPQPAVNIWTVRSQQMKQESRSSQAKEEPDRVQVAVTQGTTQNKTDNEGWQTPKRRRNKGRRERLEGACERPGVDNSSQDDDHPNLNPGDFPALSTTAKR